MMAPDDVVDGTAINVDAVFLQDRSDVFLDVDAPFQFDPFLVRRQYVPIFTDSEIKEDWFVRWMFD